MLYLHPYGATEPENIEVLAAQLAHVPKFEDPLFIFYDQEPIYSEFNSRLFDYIRDNLAGPYVLVTTEKSSDAVDQVKERYGWPVVYYFHHIFAAHDWFRGHDFDSNLVPPSKRKLTKKYITFNRITSSARVYRSLFINELIKAGILSDGHVSYGDVCPDNNHNYIENLCDARADGLVPNYLVSEAIENISKTKLPLRIDFKDKALIPNRSFILSAVKETQESFCYVVTETCFWDRKHHLTEKIFKPIISRMPFILIGPANNLAYLREYGFKTFGDYWDESYDTIIDPIERLQAASKVLKSICDMSLTDLEAMLVDMDPILNHNYELFYSKEFLHGAWNELTHNIKISLE